MQNEVPLSLELPCWEVSELHIPSNRQEHTDMRDGMGVLLTVQEGFAPGV